MATLLALTLALRLCSCSAGKQASSNSSPDPNAAGNSQASSASTSSSETSASAVRSRQPETIYKPSNTVRTNLVEFTLNSAVFAKALSNSVKLDGDAEGTDHFMQPIEDEGPNDAENTIATPKRHTFVALEFAAANLSGSHTIHTAIRPTIHIHVTNATD